MDVNQFNQATNSIRNLSIIADSRYVWHIKNHECNISKLKICKKIVFEKTFTDENIPLRELLLQFKAVSKNIEVQIIGDSLFENNQSVIFDALYDAVFDDSAVTLSLTSVKKYTTVFPTIELPNRFKKTRFIGIYFADIFGSIGKSSDSPLLFKNSEDLKIYKKETMGHPMIMGGNTYRSFGGKHLVGRQHIVISRKETSVYPSDVLHYSGLEDFLENCFIDQEQVSRMYVIGGQQIFDLFAPIITDYKESRISIVGADCDEPLAKMPSFSLNTFLSKKRDFISSKTTINGVDTTTSLIITNYKRIDTMFINKYETF